MAVNQNARDLLLQATIPRILPYTIPIDMVEGLPGALGNLLKITPSANAFTRNSSSTTATTPSTITLTAEIPSTLLGNVVWTVIAGSGSFTTSGLRNQVATLNGSTVTGMSITLQAAVGGKTAQYTISKFGALSAADRVDLTTQVVNQLSVGNVTGLGALAVLNTVNLNTQVTGALNGLTQVTNLGALAYAEGIAANQIGAGTLAAGVIYAGAINADNITSGTVTGRTIQTAASGNRIVLGPIVSGSSSPNILVYSGTTLNARISADDAAAVVYANARNGGVAMQAENSFATAALQARNTGAGPGILAFNTGSGSSGRAIVASSTNGIGIEAGGPNADAYFSGSGFVQLLVRSGTLPVKPAGTICIHNTHGICFSNGSVWGKVTFTPV